MLQKSVLILILFFSIFIFAAPKVVNAFSYPLKVSSNGRYLVDQNSSPFFMVGDAAWSLIAQLNSADANTYLSNRQQHGFNTIIVELIEHRYATNPQHDIYGDPAFTGKVFVTPNETYFAYADSIINMAAQKGITILLDPLYLGYACGSDGWCQELQAATNSDVQSWATYVGNRYKNFPNIIWLIGGDTDPTAITDVKNKTDLFASTLHSVDPNHLMTAHNDNETMAVTRWPNATWLNLNDTYSYSSTLYTFSQNAYSYQKNGQPMPFFLVEATYENSLGYNSQQLRAETYWTVLGGGMGHVFGNCPIWNFGSDPTYVQCDIQTTDWKSWLDRQGSLNMQYVGQLFNSFAWQNLVPDTNHSVVTVGYGTSGGTDYAAVARASDGSSVLAYFPTARNATVDMSKLSGSVTVRWFDPSTGVYSAITGSPFANTGTRQFSVPTTKHADGSGDWVLVLSTGNVSPPPPPPPPPPPTGNGDANNDGSVNALDLQAVLKNYLGNVTTLLNQYAVDSKINALDFVVILKRLP